MPRWLFKCYFWVCLWGGWQKRFSIRVSWLGEEDLPSPTWAPSDPQRAWMEPKGGRRAMLLFLLELRRPSPPAFRYQSSWLSGLRTLGVTPAAPLSAPLPPFPGHWTRIELDHWVSWFSSLQTAFHGISQPLRSCEPISISLLYFINMCPIGSIPLKS